MDTLACTLQEAAYPAAGKENTPRALKKIESKTDIVAVF